MSRHGENHLDGILLVDKPAEWTSFDVVNFVRRRFSLDKTGHCGTLDPFATGLLVILLGKVTRLQDSLMAQSKIYTGTIRLGEETASGDLTSEVTAQHEVPAFSLEQLQQAADTFLGDIQQVPPMHSAIKVNGQPHYKLARKGREIERPARPVHIDRFALSNLHLPEVDFEVHCSKGTYIRTLGVDLGAKLGCGAHLTALRRIASGDHHVENAVTLEQLKTWELPDLAEHLERLEIRGER